MRRQYDGNREREAGNVAGRAVSLKAPHPASPVEREYPRGWLGRDGSVVTLPLRGFEPSRQGKSPQWGDLRREGHES